MSNGQCNQLLKLIARPGGPTKKQRLDVAAFLLSILYSVYKIVNRIFNIRNHIDYTEFQTQNLICAKRLVVRFLYI